MSQLKQLAEQESKLLQPFILFQVFSGLDDAHTHWNGPSALFSSSIQMLISSRKTLMAIRRINV